ncbi:unnamed protein product, partial [Chrysoparadoxa australica]
MAPTEPPFLDDPKQALTKEWLTLESVMRDQRSDLFRETEDSAADRPRPEVGWDRSIGRSLYTVSMTGARQTTVREPKPITDPSTWDWVVGDGCKYESNAWQE